jgi:hypothetical protein
MWSSSSVNLCKMKLSVSFRVAIKETSPAGTAGCRRILGVIGRDLWYCNTMMGKECDLGIWCGYTALIL